MFTAVYNVRHSNVAIMQLHTEQDPVIAILS